MQIIDRTELDNDLALALPETDRHAGIEGAREPLGDILQTRHLHRLATRRGLRGIATVGERHGLLGGPYRHPLRHDARGQFFLRSCSPFEGKQGACMAGRQDARCHPTLHGNGEAQQADHVRDDRTRPTDSRGQLLMGDFELVEKLLVGRRLLQWVQLCAVNVLQQRVTEEVVIRGLPHNCRDGVQTRLLCGAPTPLPITNW